MPRPITSGEIKSIITILVAGEKHKFGGVNERVMQLAGEAGYLFGVGSAPEASFSRTQFLRLPSFIISGSMTPEDVLGIVKGGAQASLGSSRFSVGVRQMIDALPGNLRTKAVYLAFV